MYAYFLKKILIGFTVGVIIFKKNFHLHISMHMGFFFFILLKLQNSMILQLQNLRFNITIL